MDYELKNKLVKIISKNILTPVIYMIENDNLLDFICFCDRNIKMQEIYNVEQQIKEVTSKNVEIIDIREFGESERIEVINQSTLIYYISAPFKKAPESQKTRWKELVKSL